MLVFHIGQHIHNSFLSWNILSQMLNIFFREWGNQWLYDDEELCRRLQEAGLVNINKVEIEKSEYPELQNRETRKDSTLIYEIIK